MVGKKLIVYYSLEGNTDYAAGMIAELTESDKLRLVTRKAYTDKGFIKFLWNGRSAIMGEKPELEPYDADLSQYDMIVFGFPVWASNFTPPLRTFIEDNREKLAGKRFAAFACEAGNGGDIALGKLLECLGAEKFEESAILIEPLKRKSEESEQDIAEFCMKLKEL